MIGEVAEGVGPVEDDVDGHALAAQPGPDRAGQDLEILDDQHSHGGPAVIVSAVTVSAGWGVEVPWHNA